MSVVAFVDSFKPSPSSSTGPASVPLDTTVAPKPEPGVATTVLLLKKTVPMTNAKRANALVFKMNLTSCVGWR
jgi:hypothetical protein